jgi:hypothetical protein
MIILKSLICVIGCISLMALMIEEFFVSSEGIQCTLGDLLIILLGFFFVFYSIFNGGE